MTEALYVEDGIEEASLSFDETTKLAFSDKDTHSETGNLIESWSNARRGSNSFMTCNDDFSESQLKFEIVSARITDGPKKHVCYTIMVRTICHKQDEHPCVIERRYSELLHLYTKLRQEYPAIFSRLDFPKKAVFGNFSPEIISNRSAGFESFLLLLAQNERVRESPSVFEFFHKQEKNEIIKLLSEENYVNAIVLLKNSFHLMKKLYMSRDSKVLQVLCLLVATCDTSRSNETDQFVQLAVRLFESVSDTDSLRYYVPLLLLYVRVVPGDNEVIKERIGSMKRRGIKVDEGTSLFEVVFSDYKSSEN